MCSHHQSIPAHCLDAAAAAAAVYPRLDVDTFFGEKNSLQRDLFLQAFARIQALPADDWRSFYQIGGIHGLPFQAYRGSVNTQWPWTPTNSSWGGYCHHGSVLFPAWHRAYMLLIESVLQQEAAAVAAEYTSAKLRRRYAAAAETLRFPYWDWATESTTVVGVPDCFIATAVAVRAAPSGAKKSIRNPLRSFTLPVALGEKQNCSSCNPWDRPYEVTQLNPGLPFYPFTPKGYPTVRQPSRTNTPQDGVLQTSAKIFAEDDWMNGVFAMLQQTRWLKFSNHAGTPYGTTNDLWLEHFASLEAVHDGVHYGVGGWGGHMAYTQVAGLDPIFFFHHANVDRLFALWQGANPDTYVTPDIYLDGTFTIPPGSKIDVDTALTPFRRSDGSNKFPYYTARSVRNIDRLGYTYPDFVNNPATRSPVAFKRYILDQYRPIKNYYGTRWYVALPHARISAAPGPFAVRVFVDYPGKATVDTRVTSAHFAGSFTVWMSAPISGRIGSQVALTRAMQRLGLSVDPVPNMAAHNDFSKLQNTVGTILGYAVTKKTLQFVAVGLDGKDYSPFVALGEPLIYYTREHANQAKFVLKVVVPPNATYPEDAEVATP